jgi:activator of 2-hydroxyglutaryl-CoA dehydratase
MGIRKGKTMFYAGIDIGSTITKIVIANRVEILASVI